MRGDQLYGYIVTVYKWEPYTHMITAQQMYIDISKSFPGFILAGLDTIQNVLTLAAASLPSRTGQEHSIIKDRSLT